MKKGDFILIGGILIGALLLFGGIRLFQNGSGGSVLVTVGGVEKGRYALDEDLELDIKGASGGVNHLSIENGIASVTEADCSDKLCVHQKSIRYSGEMIVCLPHQVVIQIIEGEEAPLDGVVQ